jgi:hypothetical protein
MNAISLQILLHISFDPQKVAGKYANLDLTEGVLETLLTTGMIQQAGQIQSGPFHQRQMVLTERGRAYVDHILATPLPEQVTSWVIPERK